MFHIIKYHDDYRDDMIFCYLSAKNALGEKIYLRDDLLDIQVNYFYKNDMFWIALNDDERVVGMIGTNTVSITDMWLKRLFVKPEIKRNGIGSALLTNCREIRKVKRHHINPYKIWK